VPPAAAWRPNDGLPALGNLQFEGRNAAPDGGVKINDVTRAARHPSGNRLALGDLQFEGRNAAPNRGG
jgi:hypothetical protein